MGAFVLMGGAGGLLALRGAAPEVTGLRILTDHEYRTLAALARTHLPAGGPFPEGADDLDLARAFDAFLADEPQENVRDLKRALLLVEYGPVVFDRTASTFSHLDDAARLAHWQGWMASPVLIRRQVALAFRKFLALVFFDQERIWPHLGYPGPSFFTGAR